MKINILRAIVFVITVFVYVHGLAATNRTELPKSLTNYLQSMQVSQDEIQAILAGQPVAKVLKTETNDEVAIFGIVRIRASQDVFIEKFRNIVTFESGGGIIASGSFHTPPRPEDVLTLSLQDKDLNRIEECVPGNCGLKLTGRDMKLFQENINWQAPDATSQAQLLIRQQMMESISQYQNHGDDALPIYNDGDTPYSVRDGLHSLLQHSSDMYMYDASLANYIAQFPAKRPSDTDDIIYWQNVRFGLKPVLRASHLMIHRVQEGDTISYRIASKMLYSNHYFRSALELKSLVPDSSLSADSFYLICVNRAYVDGLTGIKGLLVRRIVKGKIRDSMAQYLSNVKRKTETIPGMNSRIAGK